MGKRQHQKDKMYLTYTEWTTLYGGKKPGHISKEEENFKRLPFDHCCLSLQPYEIPYCDLEGNIFDLEALIPFLKKFKINPVTGKPCDFKSLIQLNINKNTEGEYECPVLYKPFTKNSHIVTIATTGNVFCMEAVEQLNIKTKNWKDLLNDQPFERKDIIVLQDPNDLSKFNISSFHHIKKNIRVETEGRMHILYRVFTYLIFEIAEEIAERGDPQARLKSVNPETKYTLEELEKEYKTPTIEINKVEVTEKADKFNAAHYSTGAVAASFTSTVMAPKLVHEAAIMHEDEVRYARIKKKGYVRLVTNLGPLNLELHCDITPKACENFIKHCENGYYNGTQFFRSIRNFMVLYNTNLLILNISNVVLFRFKAETPRIPALAANPSGERNSTMNSDRISFMLDVGFSQWRTRGKIQTLRNCKFVKFLFNTHLCLNFFQFHNIPVLQAFKQQTHDIRTSCWRNGDFKRNGTN